MQQTCRQMFIDNNISNYCNMYIYIGDGGGGGNFGISDLLHVYVYRKGG